MNKRIIKPSLYDKIANIIELSRQKVVSAVNYVMTYTYYEIGKMIVEDEQLGEERAGYAQSLIKELSDKLTKT